MNIIVKLLKSKGKEKNLESNQEKKKITEFCFR